MDYLYNLIQYMVHSREYLEVFELEKFLNLDSMLQALLYKFFQRFNRIMIKTRQIISVYSMSLEKNYKYQIV